MYLPKTKFRVEDTYGEEFTDANNQPYYGKIVRTSGGRVFAGDSINNTQGILNRIEKQDLARIERPFNDYYGPTDQDYTKGFYIRYFIRDKRNGKFSEVNLEQWKEKKTLRYVTAGKFVWLLKGPVNDGTYNNVPYKGTGTKNRETLLKLENQFPGISDFFKTTSEFVR
jgi:hypothetical protein